MSCWSVAFLIVSFSPLSCSPKNKNDLGETQSFYQSIESGMSTGGRRNTESQSVYTRQASILRRNLADWDGILRDPRGEDWPRMLGRLNAALNQCSNMDKCIEDVMEHFVYQPKQSTANAQDIPFFLSTRLETSTVDDAINDEDDAELVIQGDPVQMLETYENRAAALAQEYEDEMVRF